MQKFIPILIFLFLSATSCKKDPTDKTDFPFENSTLKLEIVSTVLPNNSRITDMHFFNEMMGIVISYDGKIFKTIDKGNTWVLKFTNPTSDQPFKQLLFIDKNIGYAIGGANWCNGTGCICPGGLVLKTSDGGETWKTIFEVKGQFQFESIAANRMGDLFLIQQGFIGPSQQENKILKSSTGGTNWSMISNLNFQVNKITFNGIKGFCLGENGKILESNDDGNNWNNSTIFSEYWINDIAFRNNVGFCVSNNNSVYKTKDNGDNWTKLNYTSSYGSYKLNLLTENSCLLWGSGRYTGGCFGYSYGAVRQTFNSGNDWSENEFKDIIGGIRCTSFYSSTEGYALADKLIKVTVK